MYRLSVERYHHAINIIVFMEHCKYLQNYYLHRWIHRNLLQNVCFQEVIIIMATCCVCCPICDSIKSVITLSFSILSNHCNFVLVQTLYSLSFEVLAVNCVTQSEHVTGQGFAIALSCVVFCHH